MIMCDLVKFLNYYGQNSKGMKIKTIYICFVPKKQNSIFLGYRSKKKTSRLNMFGKFIML